MKHHEMPLKLDWFGTNRRQTVVPPVIGPKCFTFNDEITEWMNNEGLPSVVPHTTAFYWHAVHFHYIIQPYPGSDEIDYFYFWGTDDQAVRFKLTFL